MDSSARDEKLITKTSIQEYFKSSVADALDNQNVKAGDDTVYYVVNLLTAFTRAEELFERTPEGVMIRPLASLYEDAVQGATADARNRALRRLGDIALFISGVFSQSLNRRTVDLDYYVSMGGTAYGHLSGSLRGSYHGQGLSGMFEELANKFVTFVDVLDEVSEKTKFSNDTDVLRVYETWIRTGSARAAKRLRRAGIQPSENAISRLRH